MYFASKTLNKHVENIYIIITTALRLSEGVFFSFVEMLHL